MDTFRFLKFKAYCDAKKFYKQALFYSERVNDYSFKNQLRRASLSVVLNIAEGSAKKSDKDFARFLEISIGSINEVVACLDIMNEMKRLDGEEYNMLLSSAEEITKQLGGFIKSLRG